MFNSKTKPRWEWLLKLKTVLGLRTASSEWKKLWSQDVSRRRPNVRNNEKKEETLKDNKLRMLPPKFKQNKKNRMTKLIDWGISKSLLIKTKTRKMMLKHRLKKKNEDCKKKKNLKQNRKLNKKNRNWLINLWK